MTLFLGTFTGKLDRKGRVSVPAQYRGKLEARGSLDIILRPSHRDPSIEVWPMASYVDMTSNIDSLDQFSEAEQDLSFGLCTVAVEARPDGDGRVILSESLIAHAGLTDEVSFAGMRQHFQIWQPAALERRVAEAQTRLRERATAVPAGRAGHA